jgi:hypothetical protein
LVLASGLEKVKKMGLRRLLVKGRGKGGELEWAERKALKMGMGLGLERGFH